MSGKGSIKTDKRVEIAIKLYLSGMNHNDCCHFLSVGTDENKKWKVSQRQAERYMAMARKKIKELANFELTQEIGKSIARLEDLYKISYGDGKIGNCTAIVKELNNVFGIKTINLNVKGSLDTMNMNINADNMKPEDQAKILKEYEAVLNAIKNSKVRSTVDK